MQLNGYAFSINVKNKYFAHAFVKTARKLNFRIPFNILFLNFVSFEEEFFLCEGNKRSFEIVTRRYIEKNNIKKYEIDSEWDDIMKLMKNRCIPFFNHTISGIEKEGVYSNGHLLRWEDLNKIIELKKRIENE